MFGSMANVTGMAYAGGQLHYTLYGDSTLLHPAVADSSHDWRGRALFLR